MSLYKDNKMFYKILVLSKIKRGKFQFPSFLYLPPLSSLPHSSVLLWLGNFYLCSVNIKDPRSNSNDMEKCKQESSYNPRKKKQRYITFLNYVSF